jgi:hypothetical protein
MKKLNTFSAILFCVLFLTSCAEQNNYVSYFIENNLSESLIVNKLHEESSNVIKHNVDLKLTSSESFKKYLEDLTDIEVDSLMYIADNPSVDLSNAIVMLDDFIIPNTQTQNVSEIYVSDKELLSHIAKKLLENAKINFYFKPNSPPEIDFNIHISMKIKGTFVN